MCNVFKAPITCKLNPSYRLAMGFLFCCFVPVASVLVLFPRFPVLISVLCGIWLFACLKYINRYALRISARSILYLRLHKDTAWVTYKNLETASLPITGICMASGWVLLKLGGRREKVIVDGPSIGIDAYSSMARQIRAYRQTRAADQL